MGLFRTGFLACLVLGWTAFAQQPPPGGPAPVIIPDTNAPVPIVPQPEPTGVDPSLVQPAPTQPDSTIPVDPTAQKPKPKKPVAPALPTLRGSVASIDTTNMTIVVHGKSKDETLSITSKTRIFADNKPAILSDAKQGENVVVEYRNTKEKTKEALTLRFTGGGGSAATVKADSEKKSEVKPAIKKSTKATAAAKKKKKPAAKAEPKPEDAGAIVTPLPDTNAPVVPPGVVPAPVPGPGAPVPNP